MAKGASAAKGTALLGAPSSPASSSRTLLRAPKRALPHKSSSISSSSSPSPASSTSGSSSSSSQGQALSHASLCRNCRSPSLAVDRRAASVLLLLFPPEWPAVLAQSAVCEFVQGRRERQGRLHRAEADRKSLFWRKTIEHPNSNLWPATSAHVFAHVSLEALDLHACWVLLIFEATPNIRGHASYLCPRPSVNTLETRFKYRCFEWIKGHRAAGSTWERTPSCPFECSLQKYFCACVRTCNHIRHPCKWVRYNAQANIMRISHRHRTPAELE